MRKQIDHIIRINHAVSEEEILYLLNIGNLFRHSLGYVGKSEDSIP